MNSDQELKSSYRNSSAIILGSLILGSLASAFLGYYVDVLVFGWEESAVFGLFTGGVAGIILCPLLAYFMLRKDPPFKSILGIAVYRGTFFSALIVAALSYLMP